jgi:phospholipid/cholesterol/gamma-HCH transport system ATP-binding protein
MLACAASAARPPALRLAQAPAAAGVGPLPAIELQPGETLVAVGSTLAMRARLARRAVGLEVGRPGEVEVLGQDPALLSWPDLLALRSRIGWVPRGGGLLSNLSLFENLVLPLRYHRRAAEPEVRRRAAETAALLGLGEIPPLGPPLAACELVRTVALARALVMEPGLLVLDEPTLDLHPEPALGLWRGLQRALAATGAAALVLAAEADDAEPFAAPCLQLSHPIAEVA